jgi:hypothetical protein
MFFKLVLSIKSRMWTRRESNPVNQIIRLIGQACRAHLVITKADEDYQKCNKKLFDIS